MTTTPEKRYAYYWKNAEKIRERNRVYNYKKRGLEAPEKKVYKLRSMEERQAAVNVVEVVKERMAVSPKPKRVRKPKAEVAPEPAPEPAPAAPAISFTLTANDFK